MLQDDTLIFGNSNSKYLPGEIVEASYQNTKCLVKIIRYATREEYLDYMKRMNFIVEPYHGPYYFAAVGD